jgi:hypothetical protein
MSMSNSVKPFKKEMLCVAETEREAEAEEGKDRKASQTTTASSRLDGMGLFEALHKGPPSDGMW